MEGELNWRVIFAGAAFLVAAFYLLIPLLIYLTQRMTGDPKIVLFDLEKSRPPQRTARYLEEAGETLLGLGFEPQPCIALPDPMPNVRALTQLWIHPERRDAALVSAIFGIADGAANMQVHYTEILSRFASEDVAVIQTNNSDQISAFPDLPHELTFRFPQVASIGRLDRLHQALVSRHSPSARRVVSLTDQFHGDLEAYIRWVLVDSYRKQEGTGYLVYNEDWDYWRPTVKGAYLMTWSQLWPMSAILKSRVRTRANHLLRELNEESQDER